MNRTDFASSRNFTMSLPTELTNKFCELDNPPIINLNFNFGCDSDCKKNYLRRSRSSNDINAITTLTSVPAAAPRLLNPRKLSSETFIRPDDTSDMETPSFYKKSGFLSTPIPGIYQSYSESSIPKNWNNALSKRTCEIPEPEPEPDICNITPPPPRRKPKPKPKPKPDLPDCDISLPPPKRKPKPDSSSGGGFGGVIGGGFGINIPQIDLTKILGGGFSGSGGFSGGGGYSSGGGFTGGISVTRHTSGGFSGGGSSSCDTYGPRKLNLSDESPSPGKTFEEAVGEPIYVEPHDYPTLQAQNQPFNVSKRTCEIPKPKPKPKPKPNPPDCYIPPPPPKCKPKPPSSSGGGFGGVIGGGFGGKFGGGFGIQVIEVPDPPIYKVKIPIQVSGGGFSGGFSASGSTSGGFSGGGSSSCNPFSPRKLNLSEEAVGEPIYVEPYDYPTLQPQNQPFNVSKRTLDLSPDAPKPDDDQDCEIMTIEEMRKYLCELQRKQPKDKDTRKPSEQSKPTEDILPPPPKRPDVVIVPQPPPPKPLPQPPPPPPKPKPQPPVIIVPSPPSPPPPKPKPTPPPRPAKPELVKPELQQPDCVIPSPCPKPKPKPPPQSQPNVCKIPSRQPNKPGSLLEILGMGGAAVAEALTLAEAIAKDEAKDKHKPPPQSQPSVCEIPSRQPNQPGSIFGIIETGMAQINAAARAKAEAQAKAQAAAKARIQAELGGAFMGGSFSSSRWSCESPQITVTKPQESCTYAKYQFPQMRIISGGSSFGGGSPCNFSPRKLNISDESPDDPDNYDVDDESEPTYEDVSSSSFSPRSAALKPYNPQGVANSTDRMIEEMKEHIQEIEEEERSGFIQSVKNHQAKRREELAKSI